MKSFLTFAACAALAAAVEITDKCNIVVETDVNKGTNESVRYLATGLLAVNSSVGALNNLIVSFDGSQASIDALLTAANSTLDTVNSFDATVKASPPIPDSAAVDQLYLVPYIGDLNCTVSDTTIPNFIAKKDAIVAACEGPTALNVLNQLNASASALVTDVINVINDGQNNPETAGLGLKGYALTLAQPIVDSIGLAIAAYADQTSLPASCNNPPPSSSTTTGPITTGTGGSKPGYGTGNNPGYGSGGHGSGGYGTGPYKNSTTTAAPCPDETYSAGHGSSSYPAGNNGGYHGGNGGYGTKPNEGGYHNGGNNGGNNGGYGTKPNEGGYHNGGNNGGNNGGYNGGYNNGGSNNGGYNGGSNNGGSKYPSSSAGYGQSSSYPAGGAKPTGGYSTSPSGGNTGAYTGAAVSNTAGGITAVFAMVAAIALL